MAGAILMLLLLAAPGGEVTVEPLEGQPVHGRLVELSGERVVIEDSGGLKTLDPKQLQTVELGGVPVSERPQVWVDLIDGSLLPGRTFQSAGGKALYARRKATVEPVIGQIKEPLRFRRTLLRGIEKAKAEWLLVCACSNLRKLFRYSLAAPT